VCQKSSSPDPYTVPAQQPRASRGVRGFPLVLNSKVDIGRTAELLGVPSRDWLYAEL
jgi:hypothetical protein